MKKFLSLLLVSLLVILLGVAPLSQSHQTAIAAATTKSFSSNYTLVNLGGDTAAVTASYIAPNGTEWGSSIFKSFSIPAGANQIVRQYDDTGLTSGRGSVVIASSQPLGAMVQELVRTGVPSSGAYTGIDVPSAVWYIPLLAHHGGSATGIANSQIIIQNVGTSAVNFSVALYALGASTPTYTKNYTGIAAGASALYDLEEETNLPNGFWGSAVVSTASGSIGVVTNLFVGADSLGAYNAFPQEAVDDTWYVPLLYVRLGNSLTTSLAIQNLSGVSIPVGDLSLVCIKNPAAPGAGTISLTNHTAIANNGAYTFNTLTDTTRFPDAGWYGSCKLQTAGAQDIVVFVQDRFTANSQQGAYGAVPGSMSSTNVSVPLVAKRLANGFANTVTIQNLSASTATVTLTYIPSGGGTPIVRTGLTIGAGASLIRNFRLPATELPEITDGWVGSLTVTSDQPIAAFVQNTFLDVYGDRLMEYLGFNY
jgi:hypothetical protein